MLPNWTWLHSPATRTPAYGERKCSGVCRCQARTGSSSSRLKLLNTFRGRFLKATPGMKVAAYGLSSDGLVVWSEGKVLGILILNPGGEGDDRGWDGWMASPTRWTSVWVSSRVGDGQGSLACCSPWGRKELDVTEQLHWTESSTLWFQPVWGLKLVVSIQSLSICVGILVSAEQLKYMPQVVIYTLGEELRLLFYCWTIASWQLFLCFCIPSLS